MRKLASVQRIKSVEPIEGADRIELVHVLGWQCVAPKGQFNAGDLCVYFEIDSFLPMRPEFEFLRSSSYRNNEILGEGMRLKTMRFRGQISQGLVMPLNDVGIIRIDNGDRSDDAKDYVFRREGQEDVELIELIQTNAYNNLSAEGLDVTELLGVREWEIPERASTGGTIKGNLPRTVHKTDETRIQSMPGLLEEFKGLPYYITTKYDGSSHSISIDEYGEFHVTGHNYEYSDDGTSSFYEYVKNKEYERILRDFMKEDDSVKFLTVQGEFCGAGIQKNRLRLAQPDWFVFTVEINGKRIGMDELVSFCRRNGMNHVEIQEEGNDLTEVYPTAEDLIRRAEDVSKAKAYGGRQPEGIVIRPKTPVFSKLLSGNLSMKVINNKYLLKNED